MVADRGLIGEDVKTMSAVNIATQTLLAAQPVKDIVGQRVYPVYAPQGAKLPHIVIHLIHEEDPDFLSGASRYRNSRVSLELRTAGDIPGLFTLAPVVLNAMQNKANYSIAGYTATISKEGTDQTDASDLTGANGVPQVTRRIMDFYIWWR